MEYNEMSKDERFLGQGYHNPTEDAENKRIDLANENQIFKSAEDFAENERIGKVYSEEEAPTEPVDEGTEAPE